jgi:hypothetical protein
MLNKSAKFLKKMLLKKLNDHFMEVTAQRAERQFGFRNGRSTVDVIEMVLQAPRGAFIGAVQHCDRLLMVSLDVKRRLIQLRDRVLMRLFARRSAFSSSQGPSVLT